MDGPESPKRRATADDVLRDLEKRRPVFENFCREAQAHIEKCLRDVNIPFQSIQSRVKEAEKVRSKYTDQSKSDKYSGLDDLTDIAGLRVITYYEDDVDRVKELLEQEFEIDLANCEDKRLPEDPEKFTYHALHLVVSLKPETLGKRAHRQFSGIRGEIQITSILRHAWAEIEHRWYDLKDSFPPSVKRRFARLSALIDIADEQFVELREEWKQVKKSADKSVGGGFVDIPIDAQSLRAFIEQDPLVGEIDREIASATKTTIEDEEIAAGVLSFIELSMKDSGKTTINEVREALQMHRSQLPELAVSYPYQDNLKTMTKGECLHWCFIVLPATQTPDQQ